MAKNRNNGDAPVYQLEVKQWLVLHRFPPSDGWEVFLDIDAMERGAKGQHRQGKREKATECEQWLRQQGVKFTRHPNYGRVDLVATNNAGHTFVVEVEGDSSRQNEQAVYSALGQLVLSMHDASTLIRYVLAVPDSERWEPQVNKVPSRICEILRLELWLVSKTQVRSVRSVTQIV